MPYLIIIIFTSFISFLIAWISFSCLNKNLDWLSGSRIFYNFTVGLGAIMGGIGGLKYIFEYFLSKESKKKLESYQKQYPKTKIDIDFIIVNSPVSPGHIYLINKKTNTKHWIKSSQTFTDLSFFWSEVKTISEEEFKKYSDGEDIWTSGKAGS